MNSCYVVMKHIPSKEDDKIIINSVQALTENLYLAEKVIVNCYTQEFGEDGEDLVCVLAPCRTDHRTYWMRSHYKEVKGVTYFTVYEEEIKNDSALL